jgi:hypothetical protein
MRGIRGVLVLCSRWLGHQTFMRLLMDSIIRFELFLFLNLILGWVDRFFLLYKFEGIFRAPFFLRNSFPDNNLKWVLQRDFTKELHLQKYILEKYSFEKNILVKFVPKENELLINI